MRGVSHIEAQPSTGSTLDAFAQAEGQALLRFAFLLTGGNAAASEDLVQTVLLRLVDRGIDDLADPRTYARRAVLNEHRSGGRRVRTHLRALPRLRGAGPATTDPTSAAGDRLDVFTALRSLSDRERAAVVLRYYEDRTDPDIAEILGCSRATVRSLVHRAIPKLKRALDPGDSDHRSTR